MGLSSFCRRLRRNESGNVLMIGAALMPVVLGSAGLAVDTVQIAMWKRQLQRAADSAAIAGAHARAQGAPIDQSVANDLDEHVELDLVKNEQPVVTVKDLIAGSWANGQISTQTCAARNISPCYTRAVQIGLTGNRRLPFMSVFTGRNTEFSVSAAAAVISNGEYCFVALYDGDETGVDGKGGGRTDLGCGIASNATAANAVDLGGSIEVVATPIGAVGNIEHKDKNLPDTVELLPYSVAVRDPFAGVDFPEPPETCGDALPAGTPSVGNGACFVNWDVTANLTIEDNATVFVKGGEFDVRQHATVTGRNVTIILTGNDSTFSLNGGGTLDITAPDEGPLTGVALYRDRNATNPGDKTKGIKLNGGANLKISGAVYMPSTDIWFGANTDVDASCLQVITRKIEFRGGVDITNDCSAYNYGAVKQRIIRLVR